MRQTVVVVEGKNDVAKLKAIYPHLDVLTTNGAAMDNGVLTLLEKLKGTHDIVLLLDPDHAGERIRRIISNKIGHVSHVFVKSNEAISKTGKKTGIEHMDVSDLIKALDTIQTESNQRETDITHYDLYQWGLMGTPKSAILRKQVCEVLEIGQPNAKVLLKRLRLFGINKKDMIEVLGEPLR